MTEWPRVAVKSLCSLIVDCVNRTAPVIEQETPFRMIRTTNVKDGRIDLSTCRYVDEPTYERWTRRAQLLDGDVILTREAPIGEVGYIQNLGPVFLGQRLMQYRPDPEKVVPRYLYYAFRSPDLQHQFGTHDGSGSVVSHIRVADCHEFKVSVPPIDHQQNVVTLLGSIDDKIELNRRMNETLEAMAQAIFRDWFVDFGPTRRKLEGATDPLTITGGLVQDTERAQALADLFPAALGDDGLPEGWKLGPVNHVAQQHTASVLPTSFPDETFEHFSLPSYDSARYPALQAGRQILSNKTLLPPNPVLVSKLNPEIPRVWLPTRSSAYRAVSSTEFLVFTAKEGASQHYLYCMFRDEGMRQRLQGMVTGTSKSHQRVTPKALALLEVVLPPRTMVERFTQVAASLVDRVSQLQEESRDLAATRDLLLPKLMSGEVRLQEAQEVLEAAQ